MNATMTQPTAAIYTRSVSFKDSGGNRCTALATIKNGEFSLVGEFQNSIGQCFDRVQPATDAQESLLALWRRWHLNHMRAGTPEQEEALRQATENARPEDLPDFEQKQAFLDAHGLLVVPHPETGEEGYAVKGKQGYLAVQGDSHWFEENPVGWALFSSEDDARGVLEAHHSALGTKKDEGGRIVCLGYLYGSAWLKEPLPEGFQADLDALLDEIEEEAREAPAGEDDLPTLVEAHGDESAAARILALALAVEAPLSSAMEATVATWDECCVTLEGLDYLVGTDEEMDEKWDEALESFLDECVLPELSGDLANYFDREAWKRDARYDGRAHSLNRYDGGEQEAEVAGEIYYIYRQ